MLLSDCQSLVNLYKCDNAVWIKPSCRLNLEVAVSNTTLVARRGRLAD